MPNVFEEAYSSVNVVEAVVTSRIEDATATSELLQAQALETIGYLQGINFSPNAGPIPEPPRLDSTVTVDLDLPLISPTSFGALTSNLPDRPELDVVGDLSLPEIPDFTPSITSFNLPNAPAWSAPGEEPAPPELDTVLLPAEPDTTLPEVPTLEELNIPVFGGLALPTFDDTEPTFEGTALPGILQWAEPVYESEILDEVLTKIRLLWSGGSGLPAAVEQAMVERAMSREDEIANREIDAVSEEFSARGYTMPSGVQAARVDELRQNLALKKLDLNRTLTIEFAKWQIENVRIAIQEGIAAENVLINIFQNMANRTLDAAKFQVDAQIRVYDAQVGLYNARMNAYQIRSQVFDILVRAELTKIEVFKAEIEAEIARGQLNEQRVKIYTAQIQAVQTAVEIFRTQMQGAEIESNINRNRIESYRAQVEAYAARIGAEKVRFDAYASQIAGEAAKASIVESQSRAYASLVQGKVALSEIEGKRLELIIQRNQQTIGAYAADLDAEKTRIQSQLGTIQAASQAYIADTQRYVAIAGAESAKAQLEVSAKETELRSNIAFYQAKVQAYLGTMEQLIRQAAMSVDAVKAAGQLLSTMAAGSMAGIHVGASLSGGGSVSASGAYGESTSTQHSTGVNTSTNYNYEGT